MILARPTLHPLIGCCLFTASALADPVGKSDGIAIKGAVSAAGIAPEPGGDRVVIAYQRDVKPLDGDYGFARLIIPSDNAAGRAVSPIASIEVK
jgi:hypothetical protein